MKRLLAALIVVLLAGCGVPPVKVGPGDTAVAGRLTVTIDSAWNHFPGVDRPWKVWTLDGVRIDELRFWAGLKDGEALAPAANRNQRPLLFKSSMQAHEIAALFGSMHTREGMSFTLEALDPADFVGRKGVRLRYSLLRYYDDVRLSAVAWAAVREGELYAMAFIAPRAGFFARSEKQVEAIAKSARLAR